MPGADVHIRTRGIEDRASELYADLAPYLSDHRRAMDILKKALGSEDPLSYVQMEISRTNGPFRTDLKLIENRLERKKGGS